MVSTDRLFGGSIPALATPFRPGDGGLDEAALVALARRVARRGATALVVGGSTGEGPALQPEEHARAIAAVLDAGLPVIAGIGAPCTEAAVRLAQAAERCGAAALLCSAPSYVKPGQGGLRAHVRAVAAASGLPVVLYDVPSRAGIGFEDATVARLREANLIHALKDATGDLARVPRLRALCGAEFPQLSGDDATALAHLAMGGAGCISVTANLVPALCAALQDAWRRRDLDRAAWLRDRLAPLDAALFAESNPIPLKAALALLHLCDATPRLPLIRAGHATLTLLANALGGLLPLEEDAARTMAADEARRAAA